MEETSLFSLPEGMRVEQIETHRKRLGHPGRRHLCHLVLSAVFSSISIDPLPLPTDAA